MTAARPYDLSADPNELCGKRTLVLGLGSRQGGVGVARYLRSCGASVRVTDLRSAIELAGPIEELADLDLDWTLGGHDETDIHWCDVLVRNPAVPRESQWLALARDLGKRIEMEMPLFFRACPSAIVGVTGTKGKTTTTALLNAMLRERWSAATMAGNMGRSALAALPDLDPAAPVALEISSFQVESLAEHRLSPHVAVLTNISEDHLDRYETFADYAAVKGSLATYQSASDWLVVPAGDDLIDSVVSGSPGRRVTFHLQPHLGEHALWIDAGRFAGRWACMDVDLGPVDALSVPGDHSRMNALAAAGAALAVGVNPGDVTRAIARFTGVRDRLERVAVVDGVEFVNDTAATAPAAAIAALRAFPNRDLVVIAGGSDKKVSLNRFADELAGAARRVVLLDGSATQGLIVLLVERGHRAVDGPYRSMSDAVDRAVEVSRPGSIVLLSPGCASFGMFRDEFDRGNSFRSAVDELAVGPNVSRSTR